jgi:hypothetical protein
MVTCGTFLKKNKKSFKDESLLGEKNRPLEALAFRDSI